jgi:hypothetical protein
MTATHQLTGRGPVTKPQITLSTSAAPVKVGVNTTKHVNGTNISQTNFGQMGLM